MKKLISKIIFYFFINLIALGISAYFVNGFEITKDPIKFAVAVAIFTLLNVFIRPILKFILTPVIIITLGIGIFIINALMLYILDFLSVDITISGLESLIYATLIISITNIIFDFAAKSLYNKN